MSSLTRFGIVLALCFSWASLYTPAQTNPQTKTAKTPPAASISGRVTMNGKGKAGIVVGTRTTELGPQLAPLFKATTDSEGNYRITGVPAGNYHVVPIAPAFVISDFNSFGSRGKNLILAEGENVEGIDFTIQRGAVITGKVAHADGRPAVEERISVLLADQPNQRGMITSIGSVFQTDDRGIYRIYGLPPGRYKISAGQADDGFSRPVNPGRTNYQRVFYPNATSLDEAKIVELAEGGEATNIDITIGQSLPGFSANGIILDGETGQPVANVRFGVQMRVGERNSGVTGGMSNRLGEFRIENLPPGKYSVFIMPQLNTEVRGDPVDFEVLDGNVSGLVLKTSKGASLSGIVVLEGTSDRNALAKLSQLRVQAYVRSEGAGTGFMQSATINADGSFRVAGLQAGVANFSIGSQNRGPVSGFILSRVERDGVVQPRGIEVKAGEQISGLRIVVIHGSGTVRGALNFENGPPAASMRFMVRLNKSGSEAFILRPHEVDARGRFVIEGVPAGSYDVHVQAFIPGARMRPPSAKQSITVTEGAVTEVVLVMDLNPNPGLSPNQ